MKQEASVLNQKSSLMKQQSSVTKQNKDKNHMTCDVAVIGAGASGMMAAIMAAREGASVILVDGNDKAGKKLYATGNGRCNLTNVNAGDISLAFGTDDTSDEKLEYIAGVLDRFSVDAAINFFKDNGLWIREEDEGRCYPYSGQAASLVSLLEKVLLENNVNTILGDKALSVEEAILVEEAGGFSTGLESGLVIDSGAVVIACGGRAGLKFGSTGDGYGFAKAFGHSLVAPRPALVAVESDDPRMPVLKGVRAKARVSLIKNDDQLVYAETGEVQFTGTGLSGICVFNLSRFMDAPRPAGKKKKTREPEAEGASYDICIDFVPELDEAELDGLLATMPAGGFVNSRIAEAVGQDCKGTDLKNFTVRVASTKGWDDAQTTKGGVRLEEVAPETMESRLKTGLFLCGEVLDVDGRCGGFNLQWAWSSGAEAGTWAGRLYGKGSSLCSE